MPGRDATVRVTGQAWITTDLAVLARLDADADFEDRRPATAIGVLVETAFVHCGASFTRAQAWKPPGAKSKRRRWARSAAVTWRSPTRRRELPPPVDRVGRRQDGQAGQVRLTVSRCEVKLGQPNLTDMLVLLRPRAEEMCVGAIRSSTAESGPVLVGEVMLASSEPALARHDAAGHPMAITTPGGPGAIPATLTRRQLLAGAGAGAVAVCSAYGYFRRGPTSADARSRTVLHARGSTAVPINPRRVAVLGDGLLDLTLALGILPVAATSIEARRSQERGPFYSWLGPLAGAIAPVGLPAAPSLHQVTAARPDLVVGEFSDDVSYARMAALAPTVALDMAHTDWRTGALPHLASLFGRSPADVQSVLAPYDARVRRLRRRLGDPANTVVSAVTITGSDPLLTVLCAAYPGCQVLRDMGFARPRTRPFPALSRQAPLERHRAVGDRDIVINHLFFRSDARTAQLCADRAWIPLADVRVDRAHTVGAAWSCAGPSAAGVVLDDLERFLTRGA